MKTTKFDKNIKKKFENRTFEPSASAWERLSVQLDEQPKQKKIGWFFYIGAAASILLLVTVGIQIFSDDKEVINPTQEIVISPIDKQEIETNIDKIIEEVIIHEAIVENKEVEEKKEIIHAPVIANKQNQSEEKFNNVKNHRNKNHSKKIVAKVKENDKRFISNEIEKVKELYVSKEILKQDTNSVIKINADDLLYAVTHTPKEVKVYYAKYNINREDVLKTIKNELKKSNLKVNPNTILAEVERSIDDDYFENNFMKGLKRKVSDIASAIASRND